MENGSAIIGTAKKFAIKLIDNSKKLISKKMLCWKKASYSPNNNRIKIIVIVITIKKLL